MSFATDSWDLWQNEQRRTSSEPDLFFTSYSLLSRRFVPGAPKSSLQLAGFPRQKPIIHLLGLVNDIVDDSVFLGLLRVHDEVALHILFYLIQLLSAMFRE